MRVNITNDIRKDYYQSIKEHKMNFYRSPTKEINLNGKGKDIKTEIIDINTLKQKPKEQQKAIVLELQKIYGSDRKISKYLKASGSSIFRLRKKLDIPSINPLKIDYPVNIQCIYYMSTKRKVDLTNLLSATMDILVKYNVVVDDNRNIVFSNDGSKVLYSKDNPRTEIEITSISHNVFESWEVSK